MAPVEGVAGVGMAAVEAGHGLRRVVLPARLAEDDLEGLLARRLLRPAAETGEGAGGDRLPAAGAERDHQHRLARTVDR